MQQGKTWENVEPVLPTDRNYYTFCCTRFWLLARVGNSISLNSSQFSKTFQKKVRIYFFSALSANVLQNKPNCYFLTIGNPNSILFTLCSLSRAGSGSTLAAFIDFYSAWSIKYSPSILFFWGFFSYITILLHFFRIKCLQSHSYGKARGFLKKENLLLKEDETSTILFLKAKL